MWAQTECFNASYFQPGVGHAWPHMLPLHHTRSHDFNTISAKYFSTYTSIKVAMTSMLAITTYNCTSCVYVTSCEYNANLHGLMLNILLSPAMDMANTQLYITWCHVSSILTWLNTTSSRCGRGHHEHVVDQLDMHYSNGELVLHHTGTALYTD